MNVLFTIIDMDGLHGSFMHALEYGEYFVARVAAVHFASLYITPENRRIAEERGIKVHFLTEVPATKFDLVYALHLILFPALVAAGLNFEKAIFMSLSSFGIIEGPPPTEFWNQYALMTALSEEALMTWRQRYGIATDNFLIVPNAIPTRFLTRKYAKNAWSDTPKKICVVSNHVPAEVGELRNFSGFDVEYFGTSPYGKAVEISPEILLEYDAIITIGKTVQYSLGLGIPVFEYDKFGGCGYITPENMANEERTNFSGRGTWRKLSPQKLGAEILLNYAQARKNAPLTREMALESYSLDKTIEKQLALIAAKPSPPRPTGDALLFANAALASARFMAFKKAGDGLN